MKELSDEQIEKIIEHLRKGILLPEDDRLSLIKYLEQLKNSFLIRSQEIFRENAKSKTN